MKRTFEADDHNYNALKVGDPVTHAPSEVPENGVITCIPQTNIVHVRVVSTGVVWRGSSKLWVRLPRAKEVDPEVQLPATSPSDPAYRFDTAAQLKDKKRKAR